MADYKKIAEEALRKSKLGKQVGNVKPLNESVLYPESLTERMHPELENDLREKKHSLSGSPVLPEGQECTFEEAIMGERFTEVVNRYKRAFECDSIDNRFLMSNMMPLVYETMGLETKNRKELVELAIKMVREEYDMGEDVVEIHAELTTEINMVATKKVVHRHKAAPPPPAPAPSAATKSFPTAALGLGMVVLTNYQAEVKQALALLFKTFT